MEAVSRSAVHIHRDAAHIEGAVHTNPSLSVFFNRHGAHPGCSALGFACGAHPKRAKTVPNFLKFLVKPLKLTGRLYDMTCSSKFINDMVVYGYV